MAKQRDHHLIYRLNDNGQGPDIIEEVFLEKGWVLYDEDVHQEYEWNLWWRTSRFRNSDYDHLKPWQWLNHYPRSTAITKKDCLARNLKRMKGVYGPIAYDFSPIAFNLPNDYTRFVAEYTKQKENRGDICWICKPADLSRGRGIFIFKELSELQYDCNAVVQQYISNPLLIGGYKCDLRIYVMVPSFQPLQAYIYEEGLVRFSTDKFDLSCLSNQYSHLTNTSINKHSPNYGVDKERVGAGCKWTLRQLRHYFHQTGIDDNPVWGKIINIIILTLVIQAGQVPRVDRCFELYGFDIMIDDKLKPWLLEVNFSPALSADCQADILVKKNMLHDLVEMMQFREEDKLHGGEDARQIQIKKAYGSSNRRGTRERIVRRASHPDHKRNGIGLAEGSNHVSLTGNVHPEGRPRVVTSEVVQLDGKVPMSYRLQKDSARLPKITPSHSTANLGYSHMDGDESDTELRVIPIIPGCGLPSVQQTSLHIYAPSPGGSSPISDMDDGYSSTTGHSRVSKSAITQKATSLNVGYKSNNLNNTLKSPELRTKSRVHRSAPHSVLPKMGSDQSSAKYPLSKRDSKYSIQSDSGISSFSGSSDNSDMQTREAGRTTALSIITDKTNSRDDNHGRVRVGNNRGYSSEDGEEGIQSTKSGDMKIALSTGHVSASKKNPLVHSRSLPNTSNKSYASTPSKQSSKFGTTSMIPRSYIQKSGGVQPTYKLSTGGSVHQLLAARSSRRSKTVHKAEETSYAVTPRIGTRCPPERVGDFFRVFPFNDTTRKCSTGTIDIKTIIRECRQLYKERLKVVKGQGMADDLASQDHMTPPKVLDIPLLWKPLHGDAPVH